jgi:hypothetical protein
MLMSLIPQTKYCIMSRKTILILSIVIIGIIIGLIALRWVFRPAESSVKSEKADIIIDAAALVSQFETNETEANNTYNDKVVQVTGIIESVTEDELGINVTIKKPEDMSGVICSFDKQTVTKEAFIVGQSTTIKGRCTGYLMDVVLKKCSVSE